MAQFEKLMSNLKLQTLLQRKTKISRFLLLSRPWSVFFLIGRVTRLSLAQEVPSLLKFPMSNLQAYLQDYLLPFTMQHSDSIRENVWCLNQGWSKAVTRLLLYTKYIIHSN